MSFLHPEFLYYMLPPLFILFGLLLTQKESHAHFFSQEVMSKLRVSANTLTLKARNALFLLMGFFMILALAQPVIEEGKVEIKAKSADIMIAMDISDSMLASDVYPNRLEAAKQKALTLLNQAQSERVGVVAFAKNSYLVSPLSFDTSAVAFLLRQLDTSSITEKGTDFLSILDVLSKAQNIKDKKYLLILSDGGDNSDFSKEIAFAKKHNIVVFVLGIATQKGAPVKLQDGTFIKHNGDIIISKLNENIADLATKTGGVYIQSTISSDDIKAMLKEITNVSDKKELKREEVQKYIPLFYYPLLVAIFIFLIATSSISRRKSANTLSVFTLLFLFSNQHVEAGILDFLELKKAKEAYEEGRFDESANIYKKYANESQKGEGYFNAGNAYYKEKKYKEAIEAYNKAIFEDSDTKAKNLSNLGNAYVKEAKQESLQKAVESYEKSLEIKEDSDTRQNLEEVKKLLERQEQDSKDKKEQDKEQDSKDKNSDKKEDSKDGEKKEEKQKQEDSSEKKEEEQKNQADNNKTNKNSKDELEKLDKSNENNVSKSLDANMSDAEERKWIEQLNNSNSSYMYKLNDEKTKNTQSNEKPW
ncbi:MAG: VWA domain-containing protein [Sulfurimonas sp. RIFOXYD12_FULL_33_39]|uniref:vWA domain-containing protein n=1 Tax=unclassified Sulfurimonas TaxID=2623549 RepID=UPI0008BA46BB|nr:MULTISPECIES: VWA domain-containing protein [unclassified Sulfurimonas]OHE07077.1 MAG: VWA domain-containing protein [Sulfurimonas sp. RIFCSPLOWO2_12_FULL_34_6]OHE10674.1 MAG: VWA domain-containing protein [Sulfurimonas sp. RIFOXYD12_FULL_33_39]OHE13187.1 MAG: VWA domain-containing protein [Sulfurimonas sp. RIFOXYD2_FULL_34_21]DAB27471.1 MAG TPA: VWA domain-containing protein [Sulfurimonas sp. UBA10385]